MLNPNDLPRWLRENGRFCLWRYENRPGASKPAKVPYNPLTGVRADPSSSGTFGGLSDVLSLPDGFDGIAVGVFDGLAAIDLDGCINENGELTELAADVLATMNAYIELSPSGTGIHILFRVSPDFQYDLSKFYINNQQLGFECYVSGATKHTIALTGNSLSAPGVDLEIRDDQLQVMLERYMARPRTATETPTGMSRRPVDLSDDEIIEKAMKIPAFAQLWNGDITGFSSQSEADMALCNRLSFWTNGCADRVDRLFRLSGLMREKWDELRGAETYGMLTVANAVSTLTQGYNPEEYRRQQALKAFSPVVGNGLDFISARDLQDKDFQPIEFIVDQLLAPGLVLLAAKSKIGKSWMILDLCLAVAEGLPYLGFQTRKSGCLYLSLEDTQRRLKSRMNKLLPGQRAPKNSYFITEAPDLDNGLVDMLTTFTQTHPDVKLIAIDTLQKVRPPVTGRDGAYAADYQVMSKLKAFADTQGVCVVLIHHLRKMRDDGDLFDRISGTNGLMGAADTAIVLHRENRSDVETTFAVTGRDVETQELVIEFDKNTCRWNLVGEAAAVAAQRALLCYQNNPIVVTVKELLDQSPDGEWSGTAAEIMAEGKRITGAALAPTVQKLGYALKDLAPQFGPNGISYSPVAHGTAGNRHYFSICT